MVFNTTFNNISVVSFIGGGNGGTYFINVWTFHPTIIELDSLADILFLFSRSGIEAHR